MLLVDSFRAETAEGLPAFSALRARGAFIRVRASQDAATVPSIRAAYTGQTQRSVFAFARNFVHTGTSWDSIFTELAARGQTSAVFSDGSFFELAPGITTVKENEAGAGDEEARQRRAFADALARFRAGGDQLVVFHLTTADHASHAGGIDTPGYASAFATVAALIRQADAAVAPTETLVVFGDHGHDPSGSHFPGLAVPTVAVYRGPGFQPGTEAGPLPLTIHRYLLSWALGVPLSASYRGEAASGLLQPAAAVPAAFARAAARDLVGGPTRGAPRVDVALLRCARGRRRARPAPSGASAFHRLHGLRRGRARGCLRGVGLFPRAAASSSTRAAGRARDVRDLAERARDGGGRRRRGPRSPCDRRVARARRSGASAALPVRRARQLGGGHGPDLVDRPRRRRRGVGAAPLPGGPRAPVFGGTAGAGGAPAAQAAFCVMPFFYVESEAFVVGSWRGYLTSDWMGFWIVLATGARCVIFVRPQRGVSFNVVALAMIGAAGRSSRSAASCRRSRRRLAAAALLGALAVATRKTPVALPLTNAALLMAFRGAVVLDERVLLQLEVLLAALRVCQLVVDVLAAPGARKAWALWLEAMALVVSAWSTLALTLHRLEWRFLYDFVSPPVVERRIGLFLPLILARYAIPLVLARRLLSEARAPESGSTWRGAVGVAGAKLVTLTLVATGYGLFDPTNELFTEAVQNVLTFSVPLLALGYEPRPTEAFAS